MNVAEVIYNGGVPEFSEYIKLPRIMYNLPEKNPHLSNQRPDGGAVNIRSFRIPKNPDN